MRPNELVLMNMRQLGFLRQPNLRAKIGSGSGSKTDDIGFHIIADQYNGPINRLNVVPGNKNINLSAYKVKFENRIKDILKANPNAKIQVKVEPIYNSNNRSVRPDAFSVSYGEVGKRVTENIIQNKKGG